MEEEWATVKNPKDRIVSLQFDKTEPALFPKIKRVSHLNKKEIT